ncbi:MULTISPECIES: ABC transporter permease [unclassified Microbacterium]|uniref:ABC transporter permease n=1 Tax=unclassified Microbacterium TaxID=2609290 RepID=UPI001E5F95B7|nr:ABC transporter permease [Microbacterium sp. Au-Mic1]MCE4026755.1 ABC transporter permease [Microbacterium sp. Au-Mic1]
MNTQTQQPTGAVTVSVETVEGTGTARRLSQMASPGALGRGIGAISRKLLGRHAPVVDKIAFVLAGLLLVLSLVGPLLAPKDPYAIKPTDALLPPGPGHWLGTDDTGRDILSRVLAGAPMTLLAAVFVVLAATALGVLVASLSTLAPRWLDEAIMRICDMFMSIPSLVLALGLAAALGPSLVSIIVAMIFAAWPSTARIMRTILRETMTSAYVESAQITGMTRTRLMLRHALPNSLDAIYVHVSMEMSGTIVMMAGLAFLGVGAPPPSADWGSLIAQGQAYITTAWWVAFFPGLAITIAAITFGLVGDAVRAIADPASRRRA